MTTSDLSAADALRTMVVAYADVLDGELEPTGPREGFDSGDPQTSTVVFAAHHGCTRWATSGAHGRRR